VVTLPIVYGFGYTVQLWQLWLSQANGWHMVAQLAGWLAGWLAGQVAGQVAGRPPAGRLAGWLAGCSLAH